MKKMFLLPSKIAIATLASMGLASLIMPQASLADLGQPDNKPGFDSSTGNPCAGGQDGSFNMFSLIHCANLKGGDYNGADLDAAAAEFAKKQQQILQGKQPQNNSTTPDSQPLGNKPLEIKLPSSN